MFIKADSVYQFMGELAEGIMQMSTQHKENIFKLKVPLIAEYQKKFLYDAIKSESQAPEVISAQKQPEKKSILHS